MIWAAVFTLQIVSCFKSLCDAPVYHTLFLEVLFSICYIIHIFFIVFAWILNLKNNELKPAVTYTTCFKSST